uniref:Reverse transcriptase RNase H-like domain-containing protein n=1 Tax=Salvator merianae TaxID=96440 RepID=A0A8D0BFG5_SALMN
MALGVLTQQLGTWQRPVAYLSKTMDNVSKGWPGCLRSIAAASLLVTEAQKLTFGQTMYVTTPGNCRIFLRSHITSCCLEAA